MKRCRRTLLLETSRTFVAYVFITLFVNSLVGEARAATPDDHRRRVYFPEPVGVNDLVTSTIARLNSEMINRQVKVQADSAATLPNIPGNRVQLQQVLLNLLMNAMDAMVATPDAFRRIKITTRFVEFGAIEVSFRDRGHGIKADFREQLFMPFYTTRPNGLGLTICSTIAQAHGGKLTLVNHADRGAVAVFWFPARTALVAPQ